MAKKKKRRLAKPDEAFSFGPIAVSRFGKNIIWETHWPEGTFDETQKRLVEHYPEIVKEINSLITEIASLVSALPPAELLKRAWWEMANVQVQIQSESDISPEQGVALRMLDYVQSVIVAVPPIHEQRKELTEEDWTTLRSKVDELFKKTNLEYQLCRSAKQRAEDPHHDPNFEEFNFRAQLYWCNVRGSRYQIHEPEYLRDMFLPHSGVFQELFGISSEQFVREIVKIWHALSFGLQDLFEQLHAFRTEVIEAIESEAASYTDGSELDLTAIARAVIKEHGWEERESSIRDRFEGMDLYDLQKITTLPQRLLDELSWSPGEEGSFFAEGEFRGWPLRVWPVFRRPFIKLDGRYYCFDLYSLFDHIYRGIQRIILRLKPSYADQWNSIQQKASEDLPFKYFNRLLPDSKTFRSVYYRGQIDGGAIDWCETDGLIAFDDHLFIIEVKGGAFTHTPPASDFPAYVKSLENLVLKPATQGKRFLHYLRSADVVPIFDGKRRKTGEIRLADFRHVTICAVTIDPLTEMAAQVQHLRKIGVDVGSDPVWSISIDDLRVYADVFENPLVFLHYVEQRAQAFRSSVVQTDDEFDHLGLYLKHNHYSGYAEELQRNSKARISFIGYRSSIDRFFADRMYDPATPCPLKQAMPPRILEIVQWLSACKIAGRAEVAAFLLDLDEESRAGIAIAIDAELTKQLTTQRPQPISTHAGVNLTVVCWKDSCVQRKADFALEHAQVVHILSDRERRLLLELMYTDSDVLREVRWHWVDRKNIPLIELPRLRVKVEQLRKARISNMRSARGKIRRNDKCPCGSRKKYKVCCMAKL
jgi:hypothetical protein